MDSWYIIVCESCHSHRTEEVSWQKGLIEYRCNACGHDFNFSEYDDYVKKNPADPRRCSKCDHVSMQLVEANCRYDGQPDKEEAEVHRCASCAQEIIIITKEDPGTFYH